MKEAKLFKDEGEKQRAVMALKELKNHEGWNTLMRFLSLSEIDLQAKVNSLAIEDGDIASVAFKDWKRKVKLKYLRDLKELPDMYIEKLTAIAAEDIGSSLEDPYAEVGEDGRVIY